MLFDVIFIIGSILAVIGVTNALLVGRVIQGLSVGAFFTITPVYLLEITPVPVKGFIGALMGVSPSSALVISFALGNRYILYVALCHLLVFADI